jgi:hypothetical protein
MAYCKDCINWLKIQGIPFGSCLLTQGLKLPVYYEGTRKEVIGKPPAMSDLSSCSQFKQRESAD